MEWQVMPQVSGSQSSMETSSNNLQGASYKWPPGESPEWNLVECLAHPNKHGGPWSVRCKYCAKEFKSSSIVRVREHYFGGKNIVACEDVPMEILDPIRVATEKLVQDRKSLKRKAEAGEDIHSRKKLEGNEHKVELVDKVVVDKAVGRFFYTCGVPFNCARSPYFQNMLAMVAKHGSGYIAPSSERLRTSLLTEVKSDLEKELDLMKNSWHKTGCTITSDGWTSSNNRPLLNILSVSPLGEYFVKVVDTSGHEKTGEYIANQIASVIEDIGRDNVIQIIIDNAAHCKKAGKLLEEKYSRIVYSSCIAHGLDLCLEDISKLQWLHPVIQAGKIIVRVITNHHHSQALFRAFSAKHCGLELLKPTDTMFATHFIMLERLLAIQSLLQQMVLSSDWKELDISKTYEGGIVAETLLLPAFWRNVELFVTIFEPILTFLRLVDSGVPTMGKVYERFRQLRTFFTDLSMISDDQKASILSILENRWNLVQSPLHAAGFLLDPEWKGKGQEMDTKVMEGFRIIRDKFYSNIEDQVLVEKQLWMYRNSQGMFSDPVASILAKDVPAWQWWESYGSGTPELMKMAIQVLSQVTSASSCERNWSSFDFIHSKRRNRLSSDRANDLVYVFSNMRLRDKVFDPEYKEPFPEWGNDEE